MLRLVPVALALLAAASSSHPPDGREVLRRMRERGHAYRSLTFVQTTQQPGRPDQTWYESLQVPGMLRIDIAPLDSQTAQLVRNDSAYIFRVGRPVRARPYKHTLLWLISDVYFVPVDTMAAKLTGAGYDLSKVRSDTVDGRAVWVVGAAAGDTTSPQFWVDQERRYLVRMIDTQLGAPGQPLDARLTVHVQVDGIWVEQEMVFLVNGREVQREVYHDIRVNPRLDPAIFQPDQYRRPAWIP